MRIIIAIFEDVPFLGLNLYLLLQQPDLSKNIVFMVRLLPLTSFQATNICASTLHPEHLVSTIPV